MPLRPRAEGTVRLSAPGVPCLLLHGWQGTPGHLEPLGRYLHQRGVDVCIPALGPELTEPPYLEPTDDPPVVVGFSRGGWVALQLASQGGVRALVTVNTPLAFCPGTLPGPAWLEAAAALRRRLAGITVPALIVQSCDDEVVDPRSGRLIYEGIGSTCKQMWSGPGRHLVILGPARTQVFGVICRFIQSGGGSEKP